LSPPGISRNKNTEAANMILSPPLRNDAGYPLHVCKDDPGRCTAAPVKPTDNIRRIEEEG
jgi:hypothetical protein